MTSALTKGSVLTFELKSTDLSLVVLYLKSDQWSSFLQDWADRFGSVPQFFNGDPVLIDLTGMPDHAVMPDWQGLKTWLQSQSMQAVGVKTSNLLWQKAAQDAGWLVIDEAFESAFFTSTKQIALPEKTKPEPVVTAPEPLPAMVVDKPLRSGQQVYAKGRDLVVMAIVNPGAEVIADGNIHVYAPLRGKAIAGARGYHQARIFSLSMEAELVSIAGVYRTREKDFPNDVWGKPTQVQLINNEKGEILDFTRLV